MLHSYFAVVHPSTLEARYFKNTKVNKLTLHEGDHLHITDQGFYKNGEGWFILTYINEITHVYMSFADIDSYIEKKLLMNAADIEMKASLWQKQIDQALSERNREWFTFVSRKLASLKLANW
ncbi:hypothetical protein [Alteribacillus iranensis]|uniref:IDEAL domain-containing protein n=1 Tax=Alteribacillus iranensis TaxID=930128 RepID=A0A1I2DSV3_9BACI|nr:hypothetical protein [Alteribacillus iranensis]SFE83764.1 hypothetical protein SAMN05192532_104298 [Alteribacillus iranensis]